MAVEVAQLPLTGTGAPAYSSWSMFWWRLRQNAKAMIGGGIVLLLIAVALLGALQFFGDSRTNVWDRVASSLN